MGLGSTVIAGSLLLSSPGLTGRSMLGPRGERSLIEFPDLPGLHVRRGASEATIRNCIEGVMALEEGI
jgi:hypothetical protein